MSSSRDRTELPGGARATGGWGKRGSARSPMCQVSTTSVHLVRGARGSGRPAQQGSMQQAGRRQVSQLPRAVPLNSSSPPSNSPEPEVGVGAEAVVHRVGTLHAHPHRHSRGQVPLRHWRRPAVPHHQHLACTEQQGRHRAGLLLRQRTVPAPLVGAPTNSDMDQQRACPAALH